MESEVVLYIDGNEIVRKKFAFDLLSPGVIPEESIYLGEGTYDYSSNDTIQVSIKVEGLDNDSLTDGISTGDARTINKKTKFGQLTKKLNLGQLTKKLNLSSNLFESLPETLGQLINLEKLDLSSNQLTSLPETLGQLTKLTYLELSDNNINKRKLPKKVKEWLKQLEKKSSMCVVTWKRNKYY